jgi:LmbE family N-acetylglucosaminyl deacetylase
LIVADKVAHQGTSSGTSAAAERLTQGALQAKVGLAMPATSPIDEPGTSEADWAAWPALGQLPALDISRWRSAVVVAAHPDDEILGGGGVIARLAAAGSRLRVVGITDGEGSHPGHRNPAALARRRVQERQDALQALGAAGTEVIRLGLRDAGLTGQASELAGQLRDLVTGFDICLAPWESDAHGDHEAAGQAVRQLGVPARFYPVWMWHWASPADARVPWPRARRVPLSPAVRTAKQAAVACFTSQLEPRDGGLPPMLDTGFLAHFARPWEVLLPVSSS